MYYSPLPGVFDNAKLSRQSSSDAAVHDHGGSVGPAEHGAHHGNIDGSVEDAVLEHLGVVWLRRLSGRHPLEGMRLKGAGHVAHVGEEGELPALRGAEGRAGDKGRHGDVWW
ncbi:hypothetical protein [Salmonella enterica]